MAKKKILIVDDEKPTRDVMARALGATYDCLTAPDAEQAMAATLNPAVTSNMRRYPQTAQTRAMSRA